MDIDKDGKLDDASVRRLTGVWPDSAKPKTLRDEMAMAAITGIYAQPWHPDMGCDWRIKPEYVVKTAYETADEAMKERNRA